VPVLEARGISKTLPDRPFVAARRWDQLGGRLSAIVNALSVAELSDLEFVFAWPAGEPALSEPREIFSDAFLAQSLVPGAALEQLTAVDYRRLFAHTAGDPDRPTTAPRTFVEVDEIFDAVGGPGESQAAARERFKRCFDRIGWSREVQRLIDFSRSWPGQGAIAALHVRAGDIVDGVWRHVLVHEKYSPTPFVHEAVRTLTDEGRRPILVLSDNADYLAWLKERSPSVITTAEAIPGYTALTQAQQALADILLLARCEPIVGPPSSAFSRLAANLGRGELVRADRLVAEGHEREVLLNGIEDGLVRARFSRLWSGLIARDICWCLDVFSDTLTFDRQRELARQARDLAPEFIGALAWRARCLSLEGRDAEALEATARAVEVARSAPQQPDPMFQALAAEITSRCFAALRHPSRGATRHQDAAQSALDRVLELSPYWTDRDKAAASLQYMVAVVEAVRTSATARWRAAWRLRKPPVDTPEPFAAGLDEHRRVTTFDPISRQLEQMTLHLHKALAGTGLFVEQPSDGGMLATL